MFSFIAEPRGADVTADGRSGRPRTFRASGGRQTVTVVESVRNETAAYALEAGPRTVFVVRSSQGRYRLVHLLRDHSWTVEELPPRSGVGLTRVA